MNFDISDENRERRQEPSTDSEHRSFSNIDNPSHSPRSDSGSTSRSDRSKKSGNDRSPSDRSKTSDNDRSPSDRSKTSSSDRSPSDRSKTSGSDRSPSDGSKTSNNDRSPSDRSKTSDNDRSPSEKSETLRCLNKAQKTTEKTAEIKKKKYQTFPKIDKGFSWRKSPPWKRLSLKPQHPLITMHNAGGDVSRHVLSAQVHKIKELKDQLCDVQRILGGVNRENRLLTRLQHRHMKALDKYESSESGIHHLISQHSNEVRMLRENLRSSKESEQGLSLKLRMAESELLKVKDNLLRLQRLSEDKNLAEREELSKKLSGLLIKKEIDSTKVKVLEKQLNLTSRFYDRQLTLESKKASEARDMARKLQEQILLLQQMMKEKERELHIKNIYAHRLPRNLWKYSGLNGNGGLTFTRSTQTEGEMITPRQPGVLEAEEYIDLQDKSSESEHESAREEDGNSQMSGEDCPTQDVLQDEKSIGLLDIDGDNYKEQDKESSTERPNQLILEEDLGLGDARPNGQNHPDNLCNEEELRSGIGNKTVSGHRRSLLPRLSRHYIFTAATENLHQGLPAAGPISGLYKVQSCKTLKLQPDSALSYEEFSLPEIETGNGNKTTANRPEVSLSQRKKNLMEELFGPGYDIQNSFSSDFVNSEKEFNL
ncbi:lebercilin-like protein isoform 1-T6 [Anomaloglossus baeobatrachus]|uniref:lebercilin-like protein n=1 Tax=Anomaloglossus baeobatrachus TaxID=238106 RepID=UPI003F4F65D6